MTDELRQLLELLIEGRLNADQAARLQSLVMSDPAARRGYVEYLHQHAALLWAAADPATLPPPMPSAPRRTRRWAVPFALAASLAGLGVWIGLQPRSAATLTDAKACKWDGGTLPTEVGARLLPGRLRLAEGLARLTFTGGAEVTLEGPAELELLSGSRCRLTLGRLVANVPPRAIGFIVETPTAVLKDLGTEFGVNVRDGTDRAADVQVFNGEVDITERETGKTERVRTGGNRRVTPYQVAEFDPATDRPTVAAVPPQPDGTRVVTVTTADGRGKDTYVQPLYPSKHFSDVLLLVKNTVAAKSNYVRKAYLGFDLTAVRGETIRDAQLSLTFTPTGMGFASEVPDSTFAVYGLTDESLDDWDERSVRWANAPANRPGGADLDLEKARLLGRFEMAQGITGGVRSLGGPELAEFLGRDTNGLATLIVVRETPGSGRNDMVHGFAGRHHPTLAPPTLRLTVGPR